MRAVWEGLERSRRLVQERQAAASRDQLQAEHARLGLCAEERILRIERVSPAHRRPLLVLALCALVASTLAQGAPAFVCLALGLAALLFLLLRHSEVRYLTSHRVLLCRRSLLGRRQRWSVLPRDERSAGRDPRP